MQKLKLSRNLRKSILRGHPWVYGSALEKVGAAKSGEMVQVLDSKGAHLAWAFYDKDHDFALRILSLDKAPPSRAVFAKKLQNALALRLFNAETTAYRLLNGEGDSLPGMVCDRYEDVAVLQFDSEPLEKFWLSQGVVESLQEFFDWTCIINKSRHHKEPVFLKGQLSNSISIQENQVAFSINVLEGQKTGFFLDQRENRQYLSRFSQGKSFLNLFSYTGGFSIYAGVGGARQVTSVDIAPNAIENAHFNWQLNGLEKACHKGVVKDCYEFLKETKELYDMIMVDPPSMAPNEKSKPQAIKKYTDIFAMAAKRLPAEGHLFLSSCSSHINFDDFSAIIDEALSQARRTGRVLRVSGQGSDHPFRHIHPEMRYLKFYHLVLD